MNYNGNTITTLWLDLDDTIIDFSTNAYTSLIKMWRNEPLLQRLFQSPDEWAKCYERHNKALWTQYNVGQITRDYLRLQRFLRPLAEAGASETKSLEAAHRYDTLYLDYLAAEKALMPGAMELLKWLRQRGDVKIGILSNGFKEVQFRKMTTAGINSYIDIVVLSDDIGINKPDIRLYKYAMDRAKDTDPRHHLMIGDNPETDIAGAIAAGWSAIFYNPHCLPTDTLPDHIFHTSNLSDITKLLKI